MIITQRDIDDFERKYSEAQAGYIPGSDTALEKFYSFLNQNPQILLASGFQEYVSSHELGLFWSLVAAKELSHLDRPIFRNATGQWLVVSYIDDDPSYNWDAYNLSYLQANFEGNQNNKNEALHYNDALVNLPSFTEFYENAKQYINNPLVDPTILVSPKLWTPNQQDSEKLLLQHSSIQIINEIQTEQTDLSSIHWKKFEEIVAEVLRAQGMEIHLVKESPQGGRDIVGRIFIPELNEALSIAVEVKHREVVDRPLVQTALYQNRQFPALMFVTSQ
ncbi:restriction endonuclease [Desulfopila sp. IMCC35006]|uniref:restriction endonuclease n=1 Tax=Desulfopila sp. IMCC35006 TaxID=2569542 RepID=UPI0010AB8BB3|nr:restriction endonuclease [Desulfopila sp. IMCC35006]TKB23071.1 restriction endonuclease [Desulfopila sp. IMCC35006]